MSLESNILKELRFKSGYSLSELSDKTGISTSTLQRYENGFLKNAPLDKIETLANALNVSPSYLMGWQTKDTEFGIPIHEYDKRESANKNAILQLTKIIAEMKDEINNLTIDKRSGRDCFHDMRITYKLEDEDVEIIKKLCERFLEKNDTTNTSLKKHYPEIYYRNKNIEQEKKEPPQ